jgi:chromosome segregation ATPase
MENIKELSAVVEEKRAEIKSARSAAKKAVRAENYKKRKAAFMEMEEKVKYLEARIFATESAAEVLVNEETARANDLEQELLKAQDTIRSYDASLRKIERENNSLSSSYSNLICAELYIVILCIAYYISSNPTNYEPVFRYMLDM